MPHQNLTITVRPRADADDGHGHGIGDDLGQHVGNTFENHGEHARLHQCNGVVDERSGVGQLATLNFESTHGIHRLRGESNVTHHRNLGINDGFDHLRAFTSSLELHRTCSGADQHGGIAHGIVNAGVIPHPRQVTHHQRPRMIHPTGLRCLQPSMYRRGVVRHVLHRDLQRVLVAEHHHCQRVPDEDEVHARSVGDTCSGSVVGGDHHQPMARTVTAQLPSRHCRGADTRLHCLDCTHVGPFHRPVPDGYRRSVLIVATLRGQPLTGG